MTITGGSLSAALGLGGTGIALLLPEQRWLGAILIALAAALLFFDIKVEEFKLTSPMMLMFAGGAIFIIGLVWFFIQPNTTPEKLQQNPELPSLLSLFMLDTNNALHSLGGFNVVLNADTNYEIDTTTVKVLYNVIYQFEQNSKYVLFYIPTSQYDFAIINRMPQDLTRLIDEVEEAHPMQGGRLGLADRYNWKVPHFSGRVVLYCEHSLGLQELATLDSAFKNAGLNLSYRDMSYALAAWSSIRSGDTKAPPKYLLDKDGHPVLAK